MPTASDPERPLPLVFDEPRGREQAAAPPGRPRPPTSARRWSTELGLPASGPSSSPRHYFARLVDDPARDDRPARPPSATSSSAALLPRLMTPLRTLEADRGTTRKTLWRLFDGALVESVLMRYPDRVTHVRLLARPAAAWPARSAPPARAACSATCPTAEIVEQVVAGARSLARGEVPGGPGPGLQRRVHGHGRADGQLQGGDRRRTPAHRPGARRARHVRPRASPSRPSAWCRGCDQLADEGIPVTLALSPARARRRAAQRAGADQHPLERRRGRRGRLRTTPARPSAGSPSSTP